MIGATQPAPPAVLQFQLEGPAPGKPRQTQRDRWAKRPCVMEYRAWCDMLRIAVGKRLPEAEQTDVIEVIAAYEPPASWSERRRAAAIGTKKRTKPDPDNIEKAVLDALWPGNDQGVGDVIVRRRWELASSITVRITLV
jgi:Holliday junction resolvase RusA-like endonuclease